LLHFDDIHYYYGPAVLDSSRKLHTSPNLMLVWRCFNAGSICSCITRI